MRHGAGRVDGGEREPTLDGTGTLRGVASAPDLPSDPARLHAWGAVTLAYLAGLADGALEKAVEHATSREQFGAPLAALPAVQAHLADAAWRATGCCSRRGRRPIPRRASRATRSRGRERVP